MDDVLCMRLSFLRHWPCTTLSTPARLANTSAGRTRSITRFRPAVYSILYETRFPDQVRLGENLRRTGNATDALPEVRQAARTCSGVVIGAQEYKLDGRLQHQKSALDKSTPAAAARCRSRHPRPESTRWSR